MRSLYLVFLGLLAAALVRVSIDKVEFGPITVSILNPTITVHNK